MCLFLLCTNLLADFSPQLGLARGSLAPPMPAGDASIGADFGAALLWVRLPGSSGCAPMLPALQRVPGTVIWVPESFLSPANRDDSSYPEPCGFCHMGEGSQSEQGAWGFLR